MITFVCISIMHFPRVARMNNPSWLVYSTLRSLCVLHGIEVQHVSRRTLYNWSNSGVGFDHIDLLGLRLVVAGFLSRDAVADIYRSCDYTP